MEEMLIQKTPNPCPTTPGKAKSVAHVSGLNCYLCLRSLRGSGWLGDSVNIENALTALGQAGQGRGCREQFLGRAADGLEPRQFTALQLLARGQFQAQGIDAFVVDQNLVMQVRPG